MSTASAFLYESERCSRVRHQADTLHAQHGRTEFWQPHENHRNSV